MRTKLLLRIIWRSPAVRWLIIIGVGYLVWSFYGWNKVIIYAGFLVALWLIDRAAGKRRS